MGIPRVQRRCDWVGKPGCDWVSLRVQGRCYWVGGGSEWLWLIGCTPLSPLHAHGFSPAFTQACPCMLVDPEFRILRLVASLPTPMCPEALMMGRYLGASPVWMDARYAHPSHLIGKVTRMEAMVCNTKAHLPFRGAGFGTRLAGRLVGPYAGPHAFLQPRKR